jgi:type II secretory pathway component PulF
MAKSFAWTAKTQTGFTTQGICRANNEAEVRRIIKEQGYVLLTIKEVNQ